MILSRLVPHSSWIWYLHGLGAHHHSDKHEDLGSGRSRAAEKGTKAYLGVGRGRDESLGVRDLLLALSRSGLLSKSPDSEVSLHGREHLGVVRVFGLLVSYVMRDAASARTMMKAKTMPKKTVMAPSLLR